MDGPCAGRSGNFYGTAGFGGNGYTNFLNSGFGSIFEMTPDGVLTILFSFNGTNGANPSGLMEGIDGAFYGTTSGGGPAGLGTVFKFTTNSGLVTLASFYRTNGSAPAYKLVQTADGSLYGTTQAGGSCGMGTVFRLAGDGSFSWVVSFQGDLVSGWEPRGGLIQAMDGNLYGTTRMGGLDGDMFRVTTNGVLATLASFKFSTTGSNPRGPLLQMPDGTFYCTTSRGAFPAYPTDETGNYASVPYGFGTVVQITTNWTVNVVTIFNYIKGAQPFAGLTLGSNGWLYGTTYGGIGPDRGEIFVLTNAAPPVITDVSQSNGQITFSWGAITSQTYQVDYTVDLTNWSAWTYPYWGPHPFWGLPSYPAWSTNMSFSDPVVAGQRRFYRVVLLP